MNIKTAVDLQECYIHVSKEILKPLILVAEDDLTTRLLTSKVLEQKGYSVITAVNGQEAVDLCAKEHPQFILMDGSMPLLDGFEACQKIKQSTDEKINLIPVIMVTAMDDELSVNKAFIAGAEDYVTKPVNWHILDHRLNALMEKMQAEKLLRENEESFHAIAESANDAIISVNQKGEITFWNQAASQVFGYTPSEIMGKSAIILLPLEHSKKYSQQFIKVNQGDVASITKKTIQIQGVKKGGDTFSLEFTLSAWLSDGVRYYSCILRDISVRLKKQQELKKLSVAVKQSPNLVIITDLNGVIEYVNPKIKVLVGYESEEIVGRNIKIFHSGKTEKAVYNDLWQTITQGKTWVGTIENKNKIGGLYWAKESISPIFDDDGNITHYIAIQEDITEAKADSEEIAYRATHDSLTGLFNRHEFEKHLSNLLYEMEYNDEHALCFVDLDHFKIINDTAGHLAGDALLRQLGREMKKAGRKQDVLARLGGDEFTLVLSYCNQQQAMQIAEKLQKIINDFQLIWDDHIFKVGACIGLACIKKGDDAAQVLKFADTACYAAKNTGRNKIYLFNEDDSYLSEQSSELQWVQKIEQALEHDLFCLYAQKIVSLSKDNNQNIKYEVLLRILGEEGEIISPGVFLPAAEHFHLASKIDCWVIKSALNWFIQHPEILNAIDSFSINLSGQSLADEKIQSYICQLIEELNFPTDKLIFEVTETAAINNLTQAKNFMRGLKQIGIRFSLDDFGSGLSSFAYLKHLPVDFLKIDGMFVKDIVEDLIDRAMVKSINEIGQVMGKETIAEFVENQQIVDVLKEIGVDYAQGYHYSIPDALNNIKVSED